MVKPLNTIIEVDGMEDDIISSAGKGYVKPALEDFNTAQGMTILKQMIASFPSPCQSESGHSLGEPESELDPSAEPLEVPTSDRTQEPKRCRKKRRASLIDKAFKGQQIQQVQDSHEDAPPEDGPVYIRLSDLTADWSRYMPKNVTRPSREPTIVNMSMKDTDVASSEQLQAPPAIPAIQALPKRNRKKSLIDKAASQQHREMFLANLQEAKQTTPKSQQPYCSLCQGRMGRTPCSLCSRQS